MTIYQGALEAIAAGTVALGTGLKVMLVNGYTFSDSHKTYADVTAWQVSGTGYTAGGLDLTETITPGSPTQVTLANATWTGSTITASGCIIYHAASGMLIAHLGFASVSSTANVFILEFPAALTIAKA